MVKNKIKCILLKSLKNRPYLPACTYEFELEFNNVKKKKTVKIYSPDFLEKAYADVRKIVGVFTPSLKALFIKHFMSSNYLKNVIFK